MRADVTKTVSQLKDEDRWLKYFKKWQLGVIGIVAVFVIIMVKIAIKIHCLPVALFIGAYILLTVTALVMIPVPRRDYLRGGGKSLAEVLVRILYRHRKKNKVILSRNVTRRNNQ